MGQQRIHHLTQDKNVIEFAALWQRRLGARWLDADWVESIGYQAALRAGVGDVIAFRGLGCTVDELLEALRLLAAKPVAA